MRVPLETTVVALLCGLALYVLPAQGQPRPAGDSSSDQQGVSGKNSQKHGQALSSDERLSVIAAALDSRKRRPSERDCSHLVHAIYKRAGFPYAYADSSEIYAGVDGFQRVKKPQAGDLVVWPGHVGIVIQPSRHAFFSYLSAGPGVDDYEASWWRSRGHPRFYRYIKYDACPRCVPVRGSGTVSR